MQSAPRTVMSRMCAGIADKDQVDQILRIPDRSAVLEQMPMPRPVLVQPFDEVAKLRPAARSSTRA